MPEFDTNPSPVIHVIPHTHWDREWYMPFHSFRRRLVRVLDKLLSLLKRQPNYIFQLDGQVIPLEDYLEVRPENEASLREYVEKGNLVIGPWYVMPDQFLVSPESLYRNLKMGHERGYRHGKVMKVGYVPDTFGHISQMWQILRQFSIEYALVCRGMPGEPNKITSEVSLVSPDGSRVIGAFLPCGYGNARSFGYPRPLLTWISRGIGAFFLAFIRPGMRSSGMRDFIYHYICAPATSLLVHTMMRIEDNAIQPDLVREQITMLTQYATTRHLLFMVGYDHRYPRVDTLQAINYYNHRDNHYHLQIDRLEGYFDAIKEETGNWREVLGELRSSYYAPLLPGVLSTRVYLKQENHAVEDLLEKWSYPWSALSSTVTHLPYRQEALEEASQWLLQNHPHDSICGTSVDRVHREMMARFARARSLSEDVLTSSLDTLARAVDTSAVQEQETGILVFNPSGWKRDEVVSVTLGSSFGEDGVSVLDGDSTEMDSQVTPDRGIRKISFLARGIPPLGYRLFRVREDRQPQEAKSLLGTGRVLENELIRVEVHENGTFSVNHKETGREFGPLGFFEDGGDAGDTYNYSPPDCDEIITSLNQKADISLVENGPVQATIRMAINLPLPVALNMKATKRLNRRLPQRIISYLTVRSGSPLVHIRSKIENRVKDHRLRVLFPTGIATDICHAEGHWDVIERSIFPEKPIDMGSLKDTGRVFYSWAFKENPSATHPQRRFVDVNDGTVGMAVINSGLPEYEVGDDDERTIALTLLRCIGWLSRTSLKTRRIPAGPILRAGEAQCLGTHDFEYAVLPHTGNWQKGFVYAQAEMHNVPCRVLLVNRQEGTLPSKRSFISISEKCVAYSSLERARNGNLLMRLCNISDEPMTGTISFGFGIAKASIVSFLEELVEEVAVADNVVTVYLRPKEVVMLSLGLDSAYLTVGN